jgi:hypothetical protein
MIARSIAVFSSGASAMMPTNFAAVPLLWKTLHEYVGVCLIGLSLGIAGGSIARADKLERVGRLRNDRNPTK